MITTPTRQMYELTDDEMRELIEAARPVPYLIIGGLPPRSQQENANAAWCALGRKLGFDGMTVEPIAGKDAKWFTAVPVKVGSQA